MILILLQIFWTSVVFSSPLVIFDCQDQTFFNEKRVEGDSFQFKFLAYGMETACFTPFKRLDCS